jgi:subtilase family serine protease
MSKWMFAGCVSVAVGALLLGGCTAGVDGEDDDATVADAPPSEPQDGFGSPDLISINQTYCNSFSVKNQGNMTASATTLRVKFSWQIAPGVFGTQTEYFSIPSLAPGAQHFIDFYPEECFDADGDCDFVMKADYSNLVVELNESNNSLTTSCIPVP